MTPSINRMVKLLNDDERQTCTKATVIAMESRILITLNFDLNFLSPLIFLERFLRLTNLHLNGKLVLLSKELCQRAAARIAFLEFKPSEIAAAALIMAYNLTFSHQNKHSQKPNALSFWDENLMILTGYSQSELEYAFKAVSTLAGPNHHY